MIRQSEGYLALFSQFIKPSFPSWRINLQKGANIGTDLINVVRLTHGGLDDQGTNILPVLLQEGHQEVNGDGDVLLDLLRGLSDVGNSDTKAQNLLHLELDGGADLEQLSLHGLVVSEQGGEFTGLVQSGTKKTGDLTDHGLGGEEGIVLGS